MVSWGRASMAVLRRPGLWRDACSQALVTAGPRWWRRPPFLPVPDPGYLRFRLETQYGSDGVLIPEDLVRYLQWCRDQRRRNRRSR